ncbi:DASS family sodium-coupled anion symporter [Rhodoplanes sp. TEM]|uniref:DASS family sodium-coupled anion symporter n=1 Tax=Rhodoplanes tepidamans TaxID=200616 RepID=A0ABT5JBY8_RHOTP|nr:MULTISPECIES: DASS family sodium-coupled anion symporter [Rhodoplanes]MDC7787194.1 DASS family sodium-coupled anion symporter [Rhodoplanes tepidamans]MDC7984242.1 DASS family sodium-coupled anion symporter [Rhodoplanes sp. TEM]MDQ0356039.1 anion transporter [Rhodoplanes tepidamans]
MTFTVGTVPPGGAATQSPAAATPAPGTSLSTSSMLSLGAALVVLVGICMLPLPDGLSRAGLHMIAVLAFAIVLWLTEAVSYEVSALFISVVLTFLVGMASAGPGGTGRAFGTAKALNAAMSGFSNSGFIMVAAALFISTAMIITGLDKRIAYTILSKVGASSRRIIVGIIVVVALLAFMVPSGTARTACMLPIVIGLISAFGTGLNSNLAAALMLVVPHTTQLWNIAVQTGAAQNLLMVGFMDTLLHQRVTWAEWFVAGIPWSLGMSVVLYLVVTRLFPPEVEELPGGRSVIAKTLEEMGPMTGPQKRLLLVTVVLLGFWMTEKTLHNFNTTATTLAGLALLLAPGYGVMTWKELQQRTAWGTIVVFGASLGLGSALLATGAGQWLGHWLATATNITSYGPFGVFMIGSLFLIVVHIGFASVTSLTAAFMPIIIAMLQTIDGINQLGMTMFLGYIMSFGFILPINGAPNIVAMATGAFNSRQFIMSGVAITIVGYALMILMALFYWPMLGWM